MVRPEAGRRSRCARRGCDGASRGARPQRLGDAVPHGLPRGDPPAEELRLAGELGQGRERGSEGLVLLPEGDGRGGERGEGGEGGEEAAVVALLAAAEVGVVDGGCGGLLRRTGLLRREGRGQIFLRRPPVRGRRGRLGSWLGRGRRRRSSVLGAAAGGHLSTPEIDGRQSFSVGESEAREKERKTLASSSSASAASLLAHSFSQPSKHRKHRRPSLVTHGRP